MRRVRTGIQGTRTTARPVLSRGITSLAKLSSSRLLSYFRRMKERDSITSAKKKWDSGKRAEWLDKQKVMARTTHKRPDQKRKEQTERRVLAQFVKQMQERLESFIEQVRVGMQAAFRPAKST